MASNIKNIIYWVLLVLIVGLLIFSVSKEYSACKQQGYGEINFSISEITCTNYLQGGGTETAHRTTGVGLLVPIIILITILFYRQSFDQLISGVYSSFSNQSIKRESYFIGGCLFLYCLIFLLVPVFFGFQFSTKPISANTFSSLIAVLIISLAIAVPLGISIYFGKKWLGSENPKKIFYKMPLSSIVPSVIFSFFIEGYLIFYVQGGHPPAVVMWPLFFWVYVLVIIVVSLIFAVYFYKYKFSENHLPLKWTATILALLPYAIGAFGMMS